MKTIKFFPGDTNYRWDFSENSPFLKRSLTLFSHDKKIRAKTLNVKKRYYALFFANEKPSYLSRNQNTIPFVPSGSEKTYSTENKLSGSTVQIRFSMTKLLDKVIEQFKADPQSLFTEADKIKSICLQENYLIPEIEAFQKLENWEEFMHLLSSLRTNKSVFKFELMIAAITQYAARCGNE